MYLVLFFLLFAIYDREISCSYDVLSLVSIIRAFIYSVGPADESSHYKNEGRKTVWLSDSFLVTSLEYYMHPKLQHISFFPSICSLSDVATRLPIIIVMSTDTGETCCRHIYPITVSHQYSDNCR